MDFGKLASPLPFSCAKSSESYDYYFGSLLGHPHFRPTPHHSLPHNIIRDHSLYLYG